MMLIIVHTRYHCTLSLAILVARSIRHCFDVVLSSTSTVYTKVLHTCHRFTTGDATWSDTKAFMTLIIQRQLINIPIPRRSTNSHGSKAMPVLYQSTESCSPYTHNDQTSTCISWPSVRIVNNASHRYISTFCILRKSLVRPSADGLRHSGLISTIDDGGGAGGQGRGIDMSLIADILLAAVRSRIWRLCRRFADFEALPFSILLMIKSPWQRNGQRSI